MELLWSRETMIGLALLGGASSLLALGMQRSGRASPQRLRQLNRVAYFFMLASVTVFIVAGFRGPA
jgi:hypothetical protein